MSGTAKERKYIPIQSVCKNLSSHLKKNILAFHAVTGCDSTSHLASISKKSAWKMYQGDGGRLLDNLGTTPLSEPTIADAEKFLVQLFKVPKDTVNGDAARHQLFGVVKRPEALPPTSDALRQHILRSHFQANVWKNAHLSHPEVMDPEECGWKVDQGKYIPILMTLEPVPKACTDIVACQCKTLYATKMCSCGKSSLPCTKLCRCRGKCSNS